MHATRIAMFLLGGWILTTVCVDSLTYLNVRLPEYVMTNAPPVAAKIISDYGSEQASMLLRHSAAEGNRFFFDRWETVEIILGLILVPLVYFATDRRTLPVILAGFMLILALFQYFAVSPELAYRGREADFPPGRGNVATEERVWALTEVFIATEAAMVLAGGVLTIYIAAFKSRRRLRVGKDGSSIKDATLREV
jgi:hypothetical protein